MRFYTRKIKGLRRYMIALVAPGIVLSYLTCNTVAVAAPTLMEELYISAQQYSHIIAAHSVAYTVMQPVAGHAPDVLGTKVGYTMSAVLWVVFCDATALAGSWGGLALVCGAVGAAEAVMIPTGLKASPKWFSAKERSTAVGYFDVGSSIDVMIASPLVVRVVVMHSWQIAFIISGALSFIWVMCWLVFYRYPYDQKKLSDEGRDYIPDDQESQHKNVTSKKMSLGQTLRNRQLWGIALSRFLTEPAWGIFNAWILLFMLEVYDFSLKKITMFAWMPMLSVDLGCIVGGYLPLLFRRWFSVNLIASRKMVVTMGALPMTGPGTIGLFTSPYITIALLCVSGFARQALSGALIMFSSDVSGRNEVATANGLIGMSVWLASMLFALVVGTLADTTGFSPLFTVLAVFDLLGALVIWTVLQNKSTSEVDSGLQTGDPAPQS